MMENDEVALSGPLRAIDRAPSTCRSPVTLVRSSGIAGNLSRRRAAIALELNDLNLHVVANRVVGPDRSIDDAAVVELAVDILQEIRRP